MAIQKKHGKGRLDKWYKLAKEKGYRARAAFKLIQLNRKYGFLEASKVVLDLCAAPGSWCQVAAETMPQGSLIIGVDLAPIKPIPKAITFQSDITTDKCRSTIRSHLKTWKADTVLHDGAPNVGIAWVQDAYSQAELVLQALRLATDFLAPNGTFVTKIFRSKDYNALVWIFNQLFDKVEATKPPSSRDVSAEIFIVCRGFKAPKRIDPKLLDPRTVFAELAEGKPNMEAKVFNPAEKRRKREGYEEGDYTQFKETTASEFISTDDPIFMLGTYNRFNFIGEENSNANATLNALDKLDITTSEIRACCADLKVLGRKDFKHLLKWRLRARDVLGFAKVAKATSQGGDDDEMAQVEPMDEELELQKGLQDIKDAMDARKKRSRRRENEQKRKEIIRMEMNMETPMDIGVDQSVVLGEGALFSTRNAKDPQAVKRLSNGRMVTITPHEKSEPEPQSESEDEEEDRLDAELDQLYEQYQERKSMIDPKSRSKRLRTEDKDGEWHGIESNDDSDSEHIVEDEDESDDDDDDGEEMHSMQQSATNGSALSHKAQAFFAQDIFKDIDGISNEEGDSGIEMSEGTGIIRESKVEKSLPLRNSQQESQTRGIPSLVNTAISNGHVYEGEEDDTGSDQSSEASIEDAHPDWDDLKAEKEPEPSIEIITAEAMTLAQQIASGQKTSADVTDDGFNKYAFRDVDGLPEWFLDDEGKHSKKNRPITAAGAAAIKEKQRLLNARPIKKVREAQGRKKLRAARRLEKLLKKSSLLADDTGMSERDKAQGISKLMNKAAKKQTRAPVKLVVARGGNRGISGRPRGVKGRYKIVDARLKKDARALKRVAKSKK